MWLLVFMSCYLERNKKVYIWFLRRKDIISPISSSRWMVWPHFYLLEDFGYDEVFLSDFTCFAIYGWHRTKSWQYRILWFLQSDGQFLH